MSKQKKPKDVSPEQFAAYQRWYARKGFEVVDDIADRCMDAALELLAATSDYIKSRNLDPAEPEFKYILVEALSWMIGVIYEPDAETGDIH